MYCGTFNVRFIALVLPKFTLSLITKCFSLSPLTTTHTDEWYEDETGQLHGCEGYEDMACASQWYYTTVSDHMQYLGLGIGCDAVSQGRIQSVILH